MRFSFFRLIAIVLLSLCGVCAQGKTGRELIADNGLKPQVLPLLRTAWAQEGGSENAWLPIVDQSSNMLGKTGCGATALGQIMKFWEYPAYGRSSNFYVWQYQQENQYYVRQADFSQSHYDWGHMADCYLNQTDITDVQTEAVAKLMSDIGIALEMKYIKEEGTATQIEYIAMVLKKHFGYNPNLRLVLMGSGAYSIDEWLTIIYTELSEGRPVLMGGNGPTGARHLFVLDGYDAEGLVHCNMGHGRDSENTYYDLKATPTAGHHYFLNMRMLIGISPEELPAPLTEVTLSQPGMLLQALGGEKASKRICRLKVKGPLNKADFEVMRQLTVSDVGQDISAIGQLSYIDLSEAEIENDILPDAAFFVDKATPSFTLQTVKLPSSLKGIGRNAFRRCRCLYDISLPEGLTEIGTTAFFDCRALTSIVIPASLKTMSNSAFAYSKIDAFSIDDSNRYFYEDGGMILTADARRLKACVSKSGGSRCIPEGVEVIDANAFGGKSLITTITLPSTIKSIGSNAFEKCCGLTDIYCYASTAPSIEADSFQPECLSCTLHVPQGCLPAYQGERWLQFGHIVDDLFPADAAIMESHVAERDKTAYGIDGKPAHASNQKGIHIVDRKKYLK